MNKLMKREIQRQIDKIKSNVVSMDNEILKLEEQRAVILEAIDIEHAVMSRLINIITPTTNEVTPSTGNAID